MHFVKNECCSDSAFYKFVVNDSMYVNKGLSIRDIEQKQVYETKFNKCGNQSLLPSSRSSCCNSWIYCWWQTDFLMSIQVYILIFWWSNIKIMSPSGSSHMSTRYWDDLGWILEKVKIWMFQFPALEQKNHERQVV